MNFSATSGSGCGRWQKTIWRAGWLAGLFAVSGVSAGGPASSPPVSVVLTHPHPYNVFAYPPKLSLDLRRVGVLPISTGSAANDQVEGCAALGPVLVEQLIKTKRFEVVVIDPKLLCRATGRVNWTGNETLPPDFLVFLRQEYGCDGVLFAELTTYRGYAPLAIGWRFKLADARSGQIVWAADELFDAAEPSVYRAAQRFAGVRFGWPLVHDDNWQAANSPRQFGRFSATTLLNTLPER
jgi:hypothetical protein